MPLITIDYVFSYLHSNPNYNWDPFTLKNVEYADVDLLSLFVSNHDITENETLKFSATSQSNKTYEFEILRDYHNIIIKPILKFDNSQLVSFDVSKSMYFINEIYNFLKFTTSTIININELLYNK